MEVREAAREDVPAVATVLDAAMLATDDLPASVAAGRVLVAAEDDRVLGALVLDPPADAPAWACDRGADGHVAAVAVRRRRRGQGIGSELAAAAAERVAPDGGDAGRLTAEFDPDVRPFYESLGFAVTRAGDRLRGVGVPTA
jgi:GNAT superfamily N-acetyltransferase